MMGKRKIGRLTEKHYYPSARPEFLYGRGIDCWGVMEPGRAHRPKAAACSPSRHASSTPVRDGLTEHELSSPARRAPLAARRRGFTSACH